MAEFTLHIRLVADESGDGDGERLLSPYVQAHEGVDYGSAEVESPSDSDAYVPAVSSLEIDDIETFVSIYSELRREPAVYNISLWGPEAERYPVPVQHYALQELQEPMMYEFHAIDDQVTMVIADSELAAEKIQQDVPASAIGYRQSPF